MLFSPLRFTASAIVKALQVSRSCCGVVSLVEL